MTVIYDDLLACQDCVTAIANDDYSGMDDRQEAKTRRGIESWSKKGYLVVGDEVGFTRDGCDICDDNLAGDKHTVSLLGE